MLYNYKEETLQRLKPSAEFEVQMVGGTSGRAVWACAPTELDSVSPGDTGKSAPIFSRAAKILCSLEPEGSQRPKISVN